jgi:hypothetical protein
MNAKKLLVAGVLGLSMMFVAGAGVASAAPYRRPVVVGRPVYRGGWVGTYPYVYTYPAPVYYNYTYPTYYSYPPVTGGVYVGAPGVRIGIGR